MEHILRTCNLAKKYKDHLAVDNISISVGKGDIYGFLGQNGAGKTTTIKMLLGLVRQTSGSIEIFGEELKPGKNAFFERIGSIVESPGFYPNLTAHQNLDIHRRLMGVTGRDSIENAIEAVGLQDIENRPVKDYSLGMKQRLGIARALLHHPELLILDEPTNGLDPVGIKEIRQLLLDLSCKRKITIFISSHILSEIHQLATRIGIIHRGRLLEEIDYQTLQQKNRKYIQLKVGDDGKSAFLLEQKLGITDYKIIEPGFIRVYEKLQEAGKVNHMLVSNGIEVDEINLMNDSLEDYFVRLTGGAFNV
jgi:ABC-type multidrug transport system, ATPase component